LGIKPYTPTPPRATTQRLVISQDITAQALTTVTLVLVLVY